MRLYHILPVCLLLGLSSVAQTNIPSAVTSVPAATGNTTAKQTTIPNYPATAPLNYVRVWEPQRPYTLETDVLSSAHTVEEVRRTTQYFDGIGRPLQTVAWQQGTNKKDIVSAGYYDEFGRTVYSFLPFAASDGNGNFKLNPFSQLNTFGASQYPGESYYYGRTRYENSPLNRPAAQFAPGNSWAGSENTANPATEHAVKINYGVNEANEVRLWTITNSAITYDGNKEITASLNVPLTSAYYGVGTLYRTLTTDEQGVRTVEYKDVEGRVVLKKVQNTAIAALNSHTDWLCTYYVYDDFGLLRFVIPPKATQWLSANSWSLTSTEGANVVAELGFRYEYDARQRMIAKRVPGANWVYMVYDNRDRLVFTQDGNMRGKNWWMTTMYDALNRPVITGMTTSGSTLTHQALINSMTSLAYAAITTVDGMTVNASPIPTGATFTSQTKTHYDNYGWTSTSFSNTYNALLQSSNFNVYNEQGLNAGSSLTKGMVTGTEVKVIEDPNNLVSGVWLSTVTFYDDKGRNIQTNATNYKGGHDITTNLYNWAGQVVSSYQQHDNPEVTTAAPYVATKRILTDFAYNHTGKVTEIRKRMYKDNTAAGLIQTVRIEQNVYDLIGQLLTKNLGHKRTSGNLSYSNFPVQSVDVLNYAYNIRGWLKGINKNYTNANNLAQNMTDTDPWFSMELSYDWGYGVNQFNGNIAGMKWRSKGDDKGRSYGFAYDAANRLQKADFTQYGTSWVNSLMNFSLSSMGYDYNGNITALKQTGMKLNTPVTIDDLAYTYLQNSSGNTNKLSKVTDASNDNSSVLGDFKYDAATKQSSDYSYDANGNLTKDNNKKIASIAYNYLNLPSVITVTGRGAIAYIYSASGEKLEKRTNEPASAANGNTNIATTTTYLSSFVYQKVVKTGGTASTDGPNLQFFGQEEGRVREVSSGANAPYYNFDYFEKDHLGNVRLVLTDELKVDGYPALDFEGGPASVAIANQNAVWDNSMGGPIDAAGTGIRTDRAGAGMGTSASNGQWVRLIKKSTSGGAIGAAKLLKVMSGDLINTSIDYYWPAATVSNGNANGITTLATSLLSVLAGSADVSPAVKGGASVISGGLPLQPTVGSSITTPENNTSASTYPKAYLHVLLFDERFQFDNVNSVIQQIGAAGATTTIAKAVSVRRNGYAYIYFSNESDNNVYFDNFNLKHTRGPLIQETHYSPWGLSLAAISSNALTVGGSENRYKFNGSNELQNKEFSDGSGLELYDAVHRMYDHQLGRLWQMDALADLNQTQSPFVFGSDNPILFNDPLGLQDSIPTLPNVTVTTQKTNQAQILPIPLPDNPPMPIPLVPTHSKYKDPEADPITGINWWKMIDAGSKKVQKRSLRMFAKAILKVLAVLHTSNTVEDLINDGTVEGTTGNGTIIVKREGGIDQANEDFDNIVDPASVKPLRNMPGGRLGTTPDGKTVNVREKSRDGRPTLEIYNPNTKQEETKFRYDN